MQVRRRPNICDPCARLRMRNNPSAQSSLETVIPYCAAFPDRIPREIYLGQFDHRRPYPGDNDLRFELREGAERTLRAYENSVERRRERDVRQRNDH